jgi:four helix bundle protein
VGDYQKLIVWQRARAFEARARQLVQTLPQEERRRIGDQLLRAVESVRLNIAEGAGLNTDRQFARHLLLALGSANEVQETLAVIQDAGHLPAAFRDLVDEATEIRAMLAGLHRRVRPQRRRIVSNGTDVPIPQIHQSDTTAAPDSD